MLKRSFFATIFVVFFSLSAFSETGNTSPFRAGVWVTVFSRYEVLSSIENADSLVSFCKNSGITDIYLQIYRADKAYYDSALTDRENYERNVRSAGKDMIPYLIEKADASGIKVHAWINLLSLAQNYEATIIKKYGEDVLTFDQKSRPSFSRDGRDELDAFYPREGQLFLEPGDWRVREYLGNITAEILTKYPGFSGIHFDYIRYPITTPYIPGARFTSFGISYGYNRFNLLNFKKETGIDSKKITASRDNALLWDKWRRDQVTRLVMHLTETVREIAPRSEISVTVVPSPEKAYFATMQEWTKWLRKNIVDTVTVMNYTDDNELMGLYSSMLMIDNLKERIKIGIGAYLLKNDNESLKEQILLVKDLSPGGVVVFSYDDIAENKEIENFLALTLR